MPVRSYSASRPTFADDRVHDAIGASVAIVEGQAEQAARPVQQGVVDAPGVDPEAVEAECRRRLAEARQDLVEQARGIPVQAVAAA